MSEENVVETSYTNDSVIVSGNVNVNGNISSGDFVGRDKGVFLGGANNITNIHIHQASEVVNQNTSLDRVGKQIERLRGRITRLIPIDYALLKLAELREPKPIGNDNDNFRVTGTSFKRVEYRSRLMGLGGIDVRIQDTDAKAYLDELGEIETQITPDAEPEKLSQLLKSLSTIADKINIQISELNYLFTSIVYPATSSRELTENLVSKIGHKEFREEASMHLGAISQLVVKLDAEKLTRSNFDVLSDEAYGAVGIMTELEKRRLVVERLVQADRSRRNWTMSSIIIYIICAIALTVYAVLQWGTQSSIESTPLTQLRLPLLGIPWPVIIWSLIGSFAAMIHRFNSNPIYDFTDTIKWMLTRPVQGVVLGMTLYLVLISGLFLLTGNNSPSGVVSTDEVVLVLCFLIGFSDRFANGIFNTLVRNYTPEIEPKNRDANTK